MGVGLVEAGMQGAARGRMQRGLREGRSRSRLIRTASLGPAAARSEPCGPRGATAEVGARRPGGGAWRGVAGLGRDEGRLAVLVLEPASRAH